MICEKCGKSNISNLSECAYCGAEMPKTTGGGGFADILSYNSAGGATPPIRRGIHKNEQEKPVEGISELEMQRLIKKYDNIMKSTKVNSIFGLVAIGLSFLILISSIIFGIVTINTVKGYKEETLTQIEETRKGLMEYKFQVDTILEENNKLTEDATEDEVETKKGEKTDFKQKDTDVEDKNSTKETGKKDDDVKNPSSPKTDAEGNLIN